MQLLSKETHGNGSFGSTNIHQNGTLQQLKMEKKLNLEAVEYSVSGLYCYIV